MDDNPFRRKRAGLTDPADQPKIWTTGGQRPPFHLRSFGRAALYFSRNGVAPLHASAARTARRVAVNVKNGAGRIPAEKLGRAERFVPSHLRVAAWIKNLAAVLSHASATADTDVKRGNALVAEIEPHLWADPVAPAPEPPPVTDTPDVAPEPVVLQEPQPEDDPLAAIRGDLGQAPPTRRASVPDGPPAPPGPLATGAIQVGGYVLGWASSFAALPYGLVRAAWLQIKGVDLRQVGTDD